MGNHPMFAPEHTPHLFKHKLVLAVPLSDFVHARKVHCDFMRRAADSPPATMFSLFSQLPANVQAWIVGWLPLTDIARVACTARAMEELCRSSAAVWRLHGGSRDGARRLQALKLPLMQAFFSLPPPPGYFQPVYCAVWEPLEGDGDDVAQLNHCLMTHVAPRVVPPYGSFKPVPFRARSVRDVQRYLVDEDEGDMRATGWLCLVPHFSLADEQLFEGHSFAPDVARFHASATGHGEGATTWLSIMGLQQDIGNADFCFAVVNRRRGFVAMLWWVLERVWL